MQVYQNLWSQVQDHKVTEKMPQLSSFKGQSIEYQGFLGTWWLKVIPHSDSIACRKLNYIPKVVHWDKWTLNKKGPWFFCKVYHTWSILLKYSWSILKVYLKYEVHLKYIWSIFKEYLQYDFQKLTLSIYT